MDTHWTQLPTEEWQSIQGFRFDSGTIGKPESSPARFCVVEVQEGRTSKRCLLAASPAAVCRIGWTRSITPLVGLKASINNDADCRLSAVVANVLPSGRANAQR